MISYTFTDADIAYKKCCMVRAAVSYAASNLYDLSYATQDLLRYNLLFAYQTTRMIYHIDVGSSDEKCDPFEPTQEYYYSLLPKIMKPIVNP